MKSNQEERKRDQEHQDLYWFTLPQELRLVLCQQAKNSTKRITNINLNTKSITLAPDKTTRHTAAHSSLHPTTVVNNVEPYYTNPNYKPYIIWEPNSQLQITNPT